MVGRGSSKCLGSVASTRRQMLVVKYLPQSLYGFVADEEADEQIFFHLKVFHWGDFPTKPPPILGEAVEVEQEVSQSIPGKAPRARSVRRLHEPRAAFGIVDHFDVVKGYGFIHTSDGCSHYLHRSEVVGGQIPLPGMVATFFEGHRRGRLRACHVTLNVP